MFFKFGIAGYERVGKDTVAKYLRDCGVQRVALADPLKRLAELINPDITCQSKVPYWRQTRKLNDLLAEAGGWEGIKDKYPEARKFIQNLGTEACRTVFGDRVWVDLAEKSISEAKASGASGTAVTDIRHENEGQWTIDSGGLLIWVTRPGYGPINAHVSAQGLVKDMSHIWLDNSRSEDELAARVYRIFNALAMGENLYALNRFQWP